MTTEAISLLWYLAFGTMHAAVVIAAAIRAFEERERHKCWPDPPEREQ